MIDRMSKRRAPGSVAEVVLAFLVLFAANAADYVTAEMNAFFSQSVNCSGKIGDLDCEPVPASWLRLGAVGHRPAAAARGIGGH